MTFHGKIQVTGAATFTTTFNENVPTVSSCAQAAAHGDAPGGIFKVPSPHFTQNPQINIQVTKFHGPGTYPPAQLQADISDSIWLKASGVTNDYEITFHTTGSIPGQTTGQEVLMLSQDGSGQLAFSQAHKLGQKSNPAIAGLVSWTCSS